MSDRIVRYRVTITVETTNGARCQVTLFLDRQQIEENPVIANVLRSAELSTCPG